MLKIKIFIISLISLAGIISSALFIPITVHAGGLTPPVTTDSTYTCDNGETPEQCTANNPIVLWINFFINLFATVIGIGAVIMVIYSGIQYTIARDDAQKVQKAKQQLMNVVIGLVAFGFLYAFIQWLIPGGAF
jgi:cytochrome bd-type quinol oxidase subunit 2